MCNLTGDSCSVSWAYYKGKCYTYIGVYEDWYHASYLCLEYQNGTIATFDGLHPYSDVISLLISIGAPQNTKLWIGLIKGWWTSNTEVLFVFNPFRRLASNCTFYLRAIVGEKAMCLNLTCYTGRGKQVRYDGCTIARFN